MSRLLNKINHYLWLCRIKKQKRIYQPRNRKRMVKPEKYERLMRENKGLGRKLENQQIAIGCIGFIAIMAVLFIVILIHGGVLTAIFGAVWETIREISTSST